MSRPDTFSSSVVMEDSWWVRESIPLASTTVTLRGRMSGERKRQPERGREERREGGRGGEGRGGRERREGERPRQTRGRGRRKLKSIMNE